MPSSTSLALRYAAAARAAGCPRDQVEFLAAAGIALQPRQLAFAAACRLCDHPDGPVEVAFGGARMGGKSHGMLAVLGDDATRHPGLKGLLLRKVGSSARESFEGLLPKTIGRLGRYLATEGKFQFRNGSWVRLGHFQRESDVDKYLGLEYDWIGIEEATTLSASRQRAVQSCCRSPLGSGWRARTLYTTNPGGVGHAWFRAKFVQPYRNGTETSTRFIPSTIDDNAFAPPEYRAFLDSLTGWLKRAWRFGDWDIAAGQFFTTFRRDAHVLARPPEPAKSWRFWLGFDYGFTHYTSVYLLAETGDGVLYVLAEHGERRWLPSRHAAAIHAMLARHGVAPHQLHGVFAGGDVFAKRHNGGTVADDYGGNREHPLRLKPADDDRCGGAAEVLRRLGDPEAGIAPTLFLSPSCERLAECLPSLEHDPHRPEDVRKVDCDDDGRGGDDWYDALRYGVMAARRRPTLRFYGGSIGFGSSDPH